jgi:hypothetical protein
MAVKKTGSATSRKSPRSAKPKTPAETEERSASLTVNTAEPTVSTSRNAVIEGNAGVNLDEVRRRAYELYEQRGGQHGLHDEDWYRAEQEIRARNDNSNTQPPPQKKSA